MKQLAESIDSVLEVFPDLCFAADLSGQILGINSAFTERMGWSKLDLVASSLFDTLHPEDIEEARATFGKIREGMHVSRFDVRWRMKEGGFLHLDWSLRFNPDQGMVCGAGREITEPRGVSGENEQSGLMYKSIIDSQSEMICQYNPDGRLVFVNDAYCQKFGRSREDLIGCLVMDLVVPDEREASERDLRDWVANPRVVKHTEEIPLKDGTTGYQEWVDTPIFDESGELICYQGVGRDITDHVRTEVAFKAVLEHSVQGIAIIQDGLYVFLNDKYAEISGYEVSEMLLIRAEEFIDRIHPEDREMVKQRHYDRMAGKDVPSNYAFRRFRKDGTPHWVEIHASLVQWRGRPAIQVAMVDITERKNAEIALLDSESRLRTIAETIPDYICVIDTNGNFIYTNHIADGLTDKDIVGTHFLKYIPEKFHAIALNALKEAQKTRSTIDYEIEGYGAPGEDYWYHTRLSPILVEGGIQHLVMISQDITQRRIQEQEIRESRDRLELAVQGADLGLWDWNIQTGEHVVNERWAEMLGFTLPEIPPFIDGWENLLHPDDKPRVLATWDNHVERKTPIFESIHRMKTKTGEWKWILDRGKVVEWGPDGTPMRASGTHLDVTDKKDFEEKLLQTQKLESLGVLAGGIAHDFNNLLMGILGNADMAMLDLPPFVAGREYLEDIIKASQRAADLCNQMLAYAGKGRFSLQQIDLSKLTAEMAHLLEVSISKKVEIGYLLEESLPTFEGDPTQVRQVVMNLITNASDSLEDEVGRIDLKTGIKWCSKNFLSDCFLADESPEGEYIFLGVSDTGRGMDANTLNRIFDPFFTTKFKGRGLGLAAVLGIVRSHNGVLQVKSQIGKGTDFTLYFPASTEKKEAAGANYFEDSKWSGSGTVLLADDEESIRNVGRKILEKKGFTPILAVDGDDCLEKYLEHREDIQIVVLDLTMPRMSGEEAFKKLIEIDPQVRVILSSGFSESEVTSRFIGKGLAGFIQKPYRPTLLVEKIREVLESGGHDFSQENRNL